MMNYRFLITFIIIPILIILSCEDQFKVKDQEFRLEIYEQPELVNSQSTNHFRISSRISPFGFSEIGKADVEINIFSNNELIFNDKLHDNGELALNGDFSKNDGIFTVLILPQIFPGVGSYSFEIMAVIGEDNYKAENSFTVTTNIKPEIETAHFPDTIGEGSQILNFVLNDGDGLEDLEKLEMQFYNDSLLTVLHKIQIDSLSNINYSFYDVEIDSSFGVGFIGDKWIRLILNDKLDSDTLVFDNPVFFVNSAPVILQTSIPDSVPIPESGVNFILVEAEIKDARGLIEISEVYINLNDNKIELFDNGLSSENGDVMANDGIYTVVLVVEPFNEEQTYQVDFYAKDIMGQMSQSVQKSLTIYHP